MSILVTSAAALLVFIFRLVLCSRVDVSFNIICLNVLEAIKQFYLSMWFKKNCENLVLYFPEKVQKITAFAMLFWISVTKQSLENGFGFSQRSEIPTLPASLNIYRHFSTAAAFGNSVFLMENLVKRSALVSS